MSNQTCPQCKTESPVEASICPKCFFPFNGTEKEKGVFIANQIRNKSKVKNAAHGIKTAQIALTILTIFNAFTIIFATSQIEALIQFAFIISLLVAAIAVKKNPVIVLTFFGLLYILMLMIDRNLFINGLLWKAITMFTLGYGLNAVLTARKTEKLSPYLAEQSTEKRTPKKSEDLLD